MWTLLAALACAPTPSQPEDSSVGHRVPWIEDLPRTGHASVRLGEDILIIGGDARQSGAGVLKDVRRFERGRWSALPEMVTARAWHGAATLRDGTVLVAGGHDGEEALDSVEVYDPACDCWRDGGRLPSAQVGLQILPLYGDRALLLGEQTLFGHPGAWAPAPPHRVLREVDSAVSLSDDSVLVSGRTPSGDVALERFAGEWSAIAGPEVQRIDLLLALPDQGVLAFSEGPSALWRHDGAIWTRIWDAPDGHRGFDQAVTVGQYGVLLAGPDGAALLNEEMQTLELGRMGPVSSIRWLSQEQALLIEDGRSARVVPLGRTD